MITGDSLRYHDTLNKKLPDSLIPLEVNEEIKSEDSVNDDSLASQLVKTRSQARKLRKITVKKKKSLNSKMENQE